MSSKTWSKGASISVFALLIALFTGLWVGGDNPSSKDKDTPTASQCSETWPIQKADYGNTRWFADGIAEIDSAKTEAEARDALATWLDRVKTDTLLLDSAAETFLDEDVQQEDLVLSNGCASNKAVDTVLAIETVIAKSKVSAVDSAPAGTITTGVEDGVMVSLDTTGNDRAIQIIKPSGEEVWVERDCGNVVKRHRHFPPSKRKPPKKHPKCVEIPNNGIYDCGSKNPSKSTLNNDKVDDWKKDGDDRHEVDEDSDGATDSNGRQDNPKEDAKEAKEEAEKETEEKEEEHEEESKDDTKVDDNQSNEGDDDPEW